MRSVSNSFQIFIDSIFTIKRIHSKVYSNYLVFYPNFLDKIMEKYFFTIQIFLYLLQQRHKHIYFTVFLNNLLLFITQFYLFW